LDGSAFAEQALPLAETFSRVFDAQLTLVSAIEENVGYLSRMAERMRDSGVKTDYAIGQGPVANATKTLVEQAGIDLVVTSTRGGSGARHWLSGGVASQIAQSITKPLLLVQSDPSDNGRGLRLRKLLVPLDGSAIAESVLPYMLTVAQAFDSEIILLSVPEVPEASKFGAVIDWVEAKRAEAEIESWKYLDSILATVHDDCPSVRALVTGSRAASEIGAVAAEEQVDMILMATHGRGGLDRLWLGSVAERVVQNTELPVFLLPIHNGAGAELVDAVLERAVAEVEPR
jgi:nucleotide-binding universal stress UspA family protein